MEAVLLWFFKLLLYCFCFDMAVYVTGLNPKELDPKIFALALMRFILTPLYHLTN